MSRWMPERTIIPQATAGGPIIAVLKARLASAYLPSLKAQLPNILYSIEFVVVSSGRLE